MEDRPQGLLIAFYGDDFTGSTDAMEALATNGVRTALFLETPSPDKLAQTFPNLQGIGIAGVSRSMAPDAMERELRPAFEALKTTGAPIVHYKICSTFDSSPDVGSIGKAIDVGAETFASQRYIPLLVGAPALGRYTVFGNHFAAVGDVAYRLDRHPTMSRHPVTPMDEADLRMHLSKQTNRSVGSMDVFDLSGDGERVRRRLRERLSRRPDVLLYDVLDEDRLRVAGELLWEESRSEGIRFVVGSSGVEYALAAHWRRSGVTADDGALIRARGPVDRMLVVSASCSPTTAAQIRFALGHGFVDVRIDAEALVDPAEAERTRAELLRAASALLDEGKCPLLYTALGPGDDSISAVRRKLARAGAAAADSGRLIGKQLGKLTKAIVAENRLTRLLVAGGDTSGYVTRELGVYALEAIMRLAPGGPMCRAYSEDIRFDGIELVLKGGQVGEEHYFVRVRNGE